MEKRGITDMWIIYAFASAFFAGATSVLAKIGIKNTDSHLATALRTVIVLLFAWIMVFVTGGHLEISAIENRTLFYLVLSGLTTGASWICYFKALALGDVNKVVPIDKSSTILTMILACIYLNETISLNMFFGILLIGGGTLLMVVKKNDSNKKESQGRGWLFYAIASALFASLTSILGKIGISQIQSHLGTAIRTIVVLLLSWGIVFALGKQKEIKVIDRKSWIFIFLSGLATGLSWLFYYSALQKGKVSIVVPIDKLSILVTVLFAYLILKEKPTKNTLIGLLFVTIGTFLLLVKF